VLSEGVGLAANPRNGGDGFRGGRKRALGILPWPDGRRHPDSARCQVGYL